MIGRKFDRRVIAIFVLTSLIATKNELFAQVEGKEFPSITAKSLKGKKVNIPEDTNGKFTLLAMAYSKHEQEDLVSWAEPLYNKFIAQTEMFDSFYDVNLFFIPLFATKDAGYAATAERKIKNEVDTVLHSAVLIYIGEVNKYINELNLEKNSTAYFFLLNETGKILYTTSGPYTDGKLEKILDKMDEEDED